MPAAWCRRQQQPRPPPAPQSAPAADDPHPPGLRRRTTLILHSRLLVRPTSSCAAGCVPASSSRESSTTDESSRAVSSSASGGVVTASSSTGAGSGVLVWFGHWFTVSSGAGAGAGPGSMSDSSVRIAPGSRKSVSSATTGASPVSSRRFSFSSNSSLTSISPSSVPGPPDGQLAQRRHLVEGDGLLAEQLEQRQEPADRGQRVGRVATQRAERRTALPPQPSTMTSACSRTLTAGAWMWASETPSVRPASAPAPAPRARRSPAGSPDQHLGQQPGEPLLEPRPPAGAGAPRPPAAPAPAPRPA